MMFSSQSTGSILLAVGLLLKTAQAGELIGYRAVTKAEADYINDKDQPDEDAKFDAGTVTQLGKGLHIVNTPASLEEKIDKWYCAIEAEIDEMKGLDKVWIPRNDPKTNIELWYSGEENIMKYVDTVIDDDADEALRFAYDGAAAPKVMVLPVEALDDDDLDIFGQCWERKEDMTAKYHNKVVDWTKWGEIEADFDTASESSTEDGTVSGLSGRQESVVGQEFQA
ncbi:hypothetical protein LZ554_001494 [Drepanopeziza brunnea f. sp. 'monogermtubi']|nr:hypothetical protein LZ554_001494 [Drepanopeziza brunnea f. sp. 'monogermtubi']